MRRDEKVTVELTAEQWRLFTRVTVPYPCKAINRVTDELLKAGIRCNTIFDKGKIDTREKALYWANKNPDYIVKNGYDVKLASNWAYNLTSMYYHVLTSVVDGVHSWTPLSEIDEVD